MLFHNPSFLPPVRKSYFERAATKTRLNQFREGTPRECRAAPSIHCDVPWRAYVKAGSAGRTTHFGAGVHAVRRLDSQRHAHEQSGYNNQSHIFKPRRVARVRERQPQCLPEKWEGTYRLLRPCLSDCRWSSETRSKASRKTAVWAGSSRARFLCQSRLVQIYIGCDEIAIARRSVWLSQERRSTTLRSISAD